MTQAKINLSHLGFRPILVGVITLVVIPAIYLSLAATFGLPPFRTSETSLSNTEILLDRSSAMQEPLESGITKQEAAIGVINKMVLNQQVVPADSLALRQYGGPCEGANTRMVVQFGQDNKENVQSALKEIELGGDTTFTTGIAEAIGDFNDSEQFQGRINTIIAITGVSRL